MTKNRSKASRNYPIVIQLIILLIDNIFDKLGETRIAKIVETIHNNTFEQQFISNTNPERKEKIVKSTHQTYKILNL